MEKILKSVEWIVLAKLSSQLLSILLLTSLACLEWRMSASFVSNQSINFIIICLFTSDI